MTALSKALEEAVTLRRAGRFRDALSLVTPLVYAHGRFRPQGDALAEYALSLAQLGAPEAAESLLLRRPALSPKETFALALCQMLQWKHDEASLNLEEFRRVTPTAHYDSWVALANLLWCALYTGKTTEIADLYQDAKSTLAKHPVLCANAWTTVVKASFLHRLRTGEGLPSHVLAAPGMAPPKLSPYDDLALRFSASLEHTLAASSQATPSHVHSPPHTTVLFGTLAEEGLQKGLFEFARECALWEAFFATRRTPGEPGQQQAPLAHPCEAPPTAAHLFLAGYGTPFPGFRTFAKRLVQWAEGNTAKASAVRVKAAFLCGKSTWSAEPQDATQDTPLAKDPWSDPCLSLSRTEAEILATLVRDTVRPATHERLFLESHPGVPFHPETSPASVNVSLTRLRAKLKKALYNWNILAHKERGFSLHISSPLLRVPASISLSSDSLTSHLPIECVNVLSHIPATGCTRAQLEKKTHLNARTLTRLLAILVDARHVERVGKGPRTAYFPRVREEPTTPHAKAEATSATTL